MRRGSHQCVQAALQLILGVLVLILVFGILLLFRRLRLMLSRRGSRQAWVLDTAIVAREAAVRAASADLSITTVAVADGTADATTAGDAAGAAVVA